jgi:hypothetical protein
MKSSSEPTVWSSIIADLELWSLSKNEGRGDILMIDRDAFSAVAWLENGVSNSQFTTGMLARPRIVSKLHNHEVGPRSRLRDGTQNPRGSPREHVNSQ